MQAIPPRYQRNCLLFDWFLVCTIVLCKPRMASNLVDDRIQKCRTTTGRRVSRMRQIGWWWHAVNSGGDPTTFKKEKPESFPEELPVAPAE
jgi:hypothetical protein